MISPHFPPDSSAGTHRVRLLAPHLASYGWTPTVLTVAEQDYEGRIDLELAALVPSSLEVVRTRAIPAHVTRRFGLGDLGLRALPGLRRAAWALHRARPFDALFITTYPTYPAMLGPMFKRRFDVPFVLDYQDPWVGAWGSEVGGGNGGTVDAKSRATRALARRLEPRVLQAADAVTAVSARTYQDAFVRTGFSSHVAAEIPIGWDPADQDAIARRQPPHRLIPNDGRVNICYTGTLLPLGVATLRTVLAGARALIEREPSLGDRVRFYFFGTSNQSTGAEARVIPHARELGVEHLVSEHPARLDYLDSLDALRQASAFAARRQLGAALHAEQSVSRITRRPPDAGRLSSRKHRRRDAENGGVTARRASAYLRREPSRRQPCGLYCRSAPAHWFARQAATCRSTGQHSSRGQRALLPDGSPASAIGLLRDDELPHHFRADPPGAVHGAALSPYRRTPARHRPHGSVCVNADA
jgi:hypothetical protein